MPGNSAPTSRRRRRTGKIGSLDFEHIHGGLYRGDFTEERPLLHASTLNPQTRRVKVGPNRYVPSVTVRSLNEFLGVCAKASKAKRRSCIITYRGQTRDYVFDDGTISLLNTHERQSTNFVKKPGGTVFDEPMFSNPFFREFLQNLNLTERREGDIDALRDANGLQIFYVLRILQGLLQHYGFPTVCIDVSKDPIVALWFALHRRAPVRGVLTKEQVNLVTYEESGTDYGVVYILEVPRPEIGRLRKVVENVLCADLMRELPNPSWRPARQSALALSQDEWGVLAGVNFNRIAACIQTRVVVTQDILDSLDRKERRKCTMQWLFPPISQDSTYNYLVRNAALKKPLPMLVGDPEWLIHPEYMWHFKFCREHPSRFDCFAAQPGIE